LPFFVVKYAGLVKMESSNYIIVCLLKNVSETTLYICVYVSVPVTGCRWWSVCECWVDRVMLQVAVQQVSAGWSTCHWRAGDVSWAAVAAAGSPVWWQRHLEADSWTTTGMSCTDSHILTSMKELIQYNTIQYIFI